MELAARKQKILSAVIESYIATGEPVGSKTLIAQTGLDVSPATVRNEMAELTDCGLLIQPHTSAGRIPTHLGYRYYVDKVMTVTPVSERGRELIKSRLYENADSPESILQGAVGIISKFTGCASIATTPNGDDSRIRRIRFLQTGSHTAMAVLISSNGVVKTKLFRCEFVITPEILEVFDRALNELCAGIKLSSVNRPFIQTAAAKFGELSLFMPGALTAIKDAAEKAYHVSICRSGVTRLFFTAETNFSAAKGLIEFLNSDDDLARLLERQPIETTVIIGRENSRIELASSSVITTRYFVDGNPSGVLAAVGPVRTDYGRAVSILEGVSKCVGGIISELIEI